MWRRVSGRKRAFPLTGLAFGNVLSLESDGGVRQCPVDDAGCRRVLIEEVGLREEMVSRLAADTPTPPPPGSRIAQERAGTAADITAAS